MTSNAKRSRMGVYNGFPNPFFHGVSRVRPRSSVLPRRSWCALPATIMARLKPYGHRCSIVSQCQLWKTALQWARRHYSSKNASHSRPMGWLHPLCLAPCLALRLVRARLREDLDEVRDKVRDKGALQPSTKTQKCKMGGRSKPCCLRTNSREETRFLTVMG